MPHAQFVVDVRIGLREIRHSERAEDQPLEHGLMDDAAVGLLVGAQRRQIRIGHRRRNQVGVYAVEIDDCAVTAFLHAERHQDKTQRSAHT